MTPPDQEPVWREEFSVHREKEQYINRRQFTRFLVLTSLGMFVGNLWILAEAIIRRRPVFARRIVAHQDELPIGGIKLFTYPTANDPCILIRRGADDYAAFSQKCTHLACMVYYEAREQHLVCPCHEGYFAASDGRVLKGPPQRPLPRIVLERQGEYLMATAVKLGGTP